MIRINTLGYKGYYTLLNIKQFYSIIDDVVIGQDSDVETDYYEEVVNLCHQNNIKCYDRDNAPQCKSEYVILIGWRWLLPINEAKLIVFHDSLLPKYRGFNPLVSALINGDEYVGVTCLFGETGYDRGNIIAQEQIKLEYPIKIGKAIELVSRLYLNLMLKFLNIIKSKKEIKSVSQNDLNVTYSLWRDESDYFINWSWNSMQIKRFIDAVGYPYAGAKTKWNGSVLKILDSQIIEDVCIENRTPGKVIFKDSKGLTIVCGKGLLLVNTFYKQDDTVLDYSKLFRLRFTS